MNGTLRCEVIDSECSVQPCDECHICYLIFYLNEGQWLVFSGCSKLQPIAAHDCSVITHDCDLRTILSSHFHCNCFGENCSYVGEFRPPGTDATATVDTTVMTSPSLGSLSSLSLVSSLSLSPSPSFLTRPGGGKKHNNYEHLCECVHV